MADGYHLDNEQAQRLDGALGLPGADHPLTGPLVTAHDVQRWLDQWHADRAVAVAGVRALAAQVGHSAIVDALVDLGVLVEADRWEGWYGP